LKIINALTSLYTSDFSKNATRKEKGVEIKNRKTPQKFIPDALLKLYKKLPSPHNTSFRFISNGIPCCLRSHHAIERFPKGYISFFVKTYLKTKNVSKKAVVEAIIVLSISEYFLQKEQAFIKHFFIANNRSLLFDKRQKYIPNNTTYQSCLLYHPSCSL
jgi:hypothetical protein